jgi:hypothetical protein
MTPAQVRDQVMGDQRVPHARIIYQRAHRRGEIDLERIPAAVLDLPFDLVRHDLLMDLEPVKPARVRSIVDELFLPLRPETSGSELTPPGRSAGGRHSG